ncbi:hypothetical protein FF1_023842 [Malus domestica]
MVAIDKKRVKRPIIIFVGKDLLKSSSEKRDVRIPKNMIIEVVEEKSETASETINVVTTFLVKNVGRPVFSSFPPGTVNAAANIMVTMRAPTTVQEVAVSFNDFSASFANSL